MTDIGLLEQALKGGVGLTVAQIADQMRQRGFYGTNRDVTELLLRHSTKFEKTGQTWSLAQAENLALAVKPLVHEPWNWQVEAIAAWNKAHRVGVVEAVTGTGKTQVGLMAIRETLLLGGRAVVLVPTRDLVDQWMARLAFLPGSWCSTSDDRTTLASSRVIVSTIQSAYRRNLVGSNRGSALVIADECHRYGADEWKSALDPRFDQRLGLTATLERSDDGVDEVLLPYFGATCYRMSYAQALKEKVVSPWRVALVGVNFHPTEQEDWSEADGICRAERKKLIERFGLPSEPFGEFMKEVSVLAKESPFHNPAAQSAKRYLSAFSKRKELLAGARNKEAAVSAIAPLIKTSNGTLVFTDTISSAEAIARRLRATVSARAFHSDLSPPERRDYLQEFKNGEVSALVSAHVLDEGVDVPDADLGVVVAGSSSRRQMIQRMGRVLRLKPDDKRASFVVIYVLGTSEDPAFGAHEVFLDEMTASAEAMREFRSTEIDRLRGFLLGTAKAKEVRRYADARPVGLSIFPDSPVSRVSTSATDGMSQRYRAGSCIHCGEPVPPHSAVLSKVGKLTVWAHKSCDPDRSPVPT